MENKYLFKDYVYFERWASYWHQINEVLNFRLDSILVVGPGDNIVVEILRRYIKNVQTLDIEASLNPNILASVEKAPLNDNSFDLILCAEVLEHLPFEKFEMALVELKRLSKKYVILSLPHFGPPIKLSFKAPLIKEIKLAVKIPWLKKHSFAGKHYWEIGKKGYPSFKIKKMIERYFDIKKDFIPFGNQYHHFYILEKRP